MADQDPIRKAEDGVDPIDGDPDLTVEQPTDDEEIDEGAGKDGPTPNPAKIAP